jgi:hypothetical protein
VASVEAEAVGFQIPLEVLGVPAWTAVWVTAI